MRRSLSLLLVMLVSMPGCGALLFRRDQSVQLNSNLPDARFGLRPGGTAYAVGESILLDRREDHVIYASAEGQPEQRIEIMSRVSIWRAAVSVVLNGGHGLFTLFISTVLGCSVDIGAGAWQVLEPDVVHAEFGGSVAGAESTTSWRPAKPGQPAFCSSCGARANDAPFCSGCGAKLR